MRAEAHAKNEDETNDGQAEASTQIKGKADQIKAQKSQIQSFLKENVDGQEVKENNCSSQEVESPTIDVDSKSKNQDSLTNSSDANIMTVKMMANDENSDPITKDNKNNMLNIGTGFRKR